MAVEINLLPDKKVHLSPETEGSVKTFVRITTIILFLVVIVGASVFAYGQAMVAQKADLIKKITTLETTITGYKQREIYLVLLKQKLTGIKGILVKRPDLAKEISILQALLPEGVTIEKFTGDKSGALTVAVEASNSTSMDLFLKNLTRNKHYGNVVVSGLTGDMTKGYKFNFSTKIQEGVWL